MSSYICGIVDTYESGCQRSWTWGCYSFGMTGFSRKFLFRKLYRRILTPYAQGHQADQSSQQHEVSSGQMKGYSTRDVAELLEIPPEVIRDIARAGILEPARTAGNHYRFDFQDIIILRTAKELLQSGVKRAQINNALFRLKSKLPSSISVVHNIPEIIINAYSSSFFFIT